MSLLDKLTSLEPQINRARCAVCSLLEVLDEKEAEVLSDLIAVPVGSPTRITDRQLSDVLKSEGYVVSSNSIFRHRQNHLEK